MSKHKLHSNFILLRFSVVACVVSLLVFGLLLIQSGRNQNKAQASTYNADQIIYAVNQERKKAGLPALTVNAKLSKAAQNKAKDMAQKSYFSHVSPVDGRKWSDFIKEANYNYAEAGENLANGFDSVPPMIEKWMNSPTHKENMLNPGVLETGVGVEFGELDNYPTIFVAQDFGRELVVTPEKPKPAPQPAPEPVQQPAVQPTPAPEPKKPETLGDLLSLPEVTLGKEQ